MKSEKENRDGKLKECMDIELEQTVIDPKCVQKVVKRADTHIQTQKLVHLTLEKLKSF